MKKYIFHKLYKRLLNISIKREQDRIHNWNDNSTLSYGLNRSPRETKVIVSMTSFAKRLSEIHICLKSLINQSVKADRLIVWLGPDVRETDITEEMHLLEQYGVEYVFVPLDLKPHKKYYYAMQQYPDAIIITVDDDVVYADDTIESLLKTHQKYPKAVCARRVHYMAVKDNCILPYNEWKQDCRDVKKTSYRLMPTGVGGVLYPPRLLSSEVLNLENIQSLCLNADDIWLKWMELLNHIPVVWTPCLMTLPLVIDSAQEIALFKSNVNQNFNDECISKLLEVYPEVIHILIKNK